MNVRWILFALIVIWSSGAVAHRGHNKKEPKKAATTAPSRRSPASQPHVSKEPSARRPVAANADSTRAPSNDWREVDPVVAETDPSRSDGALTILGKLHPALVHFPIGWVVLLLFLEFWPKKTRDAEQRRGLITSLLILGLAATVAGIGSGLLRHGTHGPTDVEAMIVSHRNVMLIAAAIFAIATAVRGRGLHCIRRRIYLALLAAAAIVMLFGAHLGGRIVFGADYLPF